MLLEVLRIFLFLDKVLLLVSRCHLTTHQFHISGMMHYSIITQYVVTQRTLQRIDSQYLEVLMIKYSGINEKLYTVWEKILFVFMGSTGQLC